MKDNLNFSRTNDLYESIFSYYNQIINDYPEKIITVLQKQFEKFEFLFNTSLVVNRKSQGDYMSFSLGQSSPYIDYSEFVSQFTKERDFYFLSNGNREFEKINVPLSYDSNFLERIPIRSKRVDDFHNIDRDRAREKKIYILLNSVNK
jgi:hypothetical protein